MQRRRFGMGLMVGLLLMVTGFLQPAEAADQITVYAAASVTNVVQDLAALYEKEKGTKVAMSFAGSSALAKQIEQGAPADLFISADLRWMDYLAEQGKIDQGSRRNLVGNRLVLIAPKGQGFPVKLEKGFDLPGAFQGRWCSTDASVPIGQYSQQALTALGWWPALQSRLAAAADVRAALAFVERGECAVGIVYETDAKMSDQVEILGIFPSDTYPPVIYPAALVQGGKPAAKGFMEFLHTPAATKLFRQYGFTVLN